MVMLVEVAAVVDEVAAVVAVVVVVVVVTAVAAVAVAVVVDAAVDVPWMTVAVQAEETVEDSTTWSFDAID